MERTGWIYQFPVAEGYVHLVILPHICFRFCKKLEGSGQRIVHKVHTVQVQVLHVCDQHSIHFLLVEGCIQRHIHLCKRIMTKQVEFQQVLFQRTV